MKSRQNKIVVALTCVVIAISTPISILRSFEKKQTTLNEIYYSKPNIHSDLEQRISNAYNLGVIAKRYNVSERELLSIADELKMASIAQARKLNISLEKAFEACRDQLLALELSEKDREYVDGIDSEFMANQDRIDRSSYHEAVVNLQEELKHFPAHQLQSLFGYTYELY